jgi:hypothetical protein
LKPKHTKTGNLFCSKIKFLLKRERERERRFPYECILLMEGHRRVFPKKYFHGNMRTYNIGELPGHNALGFFCWGRSLKLHIEIKR